jgi:hypothetical protein
MRAAGRTKIPTMSHDHLIRVEVETRFLDDQSAPDDRNPGVRRGLAGEGQVRFFDGQRAPSEIDDTTDLEDHKARPGDLESAAEGAGTVRRERRHSHDDAAGTG